MAAVAELEVARFQMLMAAMEAMEMQMEQMASPHLMEVVVLLPVVPLLVRQALDVLDF